MRFRVTLALVVLLATTASAQTTSFLPPELQAGEEDWGWAGAEPSSQKHEWWQWLPPPEYGPQSERGTGVRLTAWKFAGVELAINIGLQRDPLALVDLLREANAESPYPLFRIDPAFFVAEAPETDLFNSFIDILNYQRLIYVFVRF
jgi:hypothetical protein